MFKKLHQDLTESVLKDLINRVNLDCEIDSEVYFLMQDLVRKNLSYNQNHRLHTRELERFMRISQLLSSRRFRKNPIPEAGDIVNLGILDAQGLNKYPTALLMNDIYERSEIAELTVCTQPSGIHIDHNHRMDTALRMQVSGGYFSNVKTGNLKLSSETRNQTFWFWGNTPCAGGGIYIQRPMLVWDCIVTQENFY